MSRCMTKLTVNWLLQSRPERPASSRTSWALVLNDGVEGRLLHLGLEAGRAAAAVVVQVGRDLERRLAAAQGSRGGVAAGGEPAEAGRGKQITEISLLG